MLSVILNSFPFHRNMQGYPEVLNVNRGNNASAIDDLTKPYVANGAG